MLLLTIFLCPLIIRAETELKSTTPKEPHCTFDSVKQVLHCKNIAHQFPASFNKDDNCDGCKLVCDSCSFEELDESSFAKLNQKSRIREIEFKGGRIDGIAAHAFRSFEILTIDLEQVQLKHIKEDAFAGLMITGLYLTQNQLSEVHPNFFKNIISDPTWRLSLASNRIHKIHASSFSNIRSLKRLSLANNQLCTIPAGTFSGLNQLLTLDLSSNKLKRLHLETFVGLTKLAYLNLSNNQLVRTNLNYFKVLESDLKMGFLWLDLTNTSLQYLDGVNDAFALRRLKKIRLSKNIWSCPVLENLIWSFQNRGVEVDHDDNLNVTNIFGIACQEWGSNTDMLEIADENISYEEFLQILEEDSSNPHDTCAQSGNWLVYN